LYWILGQRIQAVTLTKEVLLQVMFRTESSEDIGAAAMLKKGGEGRMSLVGESIAHPLYAHCVTSDLYPQ
jgi:hypothetical protein